MVGDDIVHWETHMTTGEGCVSISKKLVAHIISLLFQMRI